MKLKTLAIFAALLFFCNTANAIPGVLDPTFNGTGKAKFRYGLGVDQVFDVISLPDGKTIVAGVAVFSDDYKGSLVKYNQDGTTDDSFGIGGKFVWGAPLLGNFYSASLAQDGKIVVVSDYAAARVNADGTPDTSFGINGVTQFPPGAFYKAKVLPDGKILAGGVRPNGRSCKIVFVRLNSDGSLDQSFGTDGVAALENRGRYEIFSDFDVDQSGGIVVTGQYKPKYDPAFAYATLTARFTPGGSVDTAFGQSGRMIFAPELGSIGTLVAVQNDGKIVVGGLSSQNYPVAQQPFLMRSNADGSIDTSFNGTGSMFFQSSQLQRIREILPLPDGKILLAADMLGGVDSAVLRVNSYGGLDNTFGSRGSRPVPSFYVECAALHSDGRLALGGKESYQSPEDINLVMLDSTGGFDTGFGALGRVITDVGERKASNAELLVQPDGKMISIGSILSSGAYTAFGVARYNTDGTADRSFAGDGNMALAGCQWSAYERAAALQGTKIIVACGDHFDHTMTRIDQNGKVDTTFGVNGTSRIDLGGKEPAKIVALPDGKILTYNSDYTQIGTLSRFEADGAPDNTFGSGGQVTASLPTGVKSIETMILQPDGKILIGGTYRFNNQMKNRFMLARFNADGSADTGFGFGGSILADSGTEADEAAVVFILGTDGRITAVGTRTKLAQPTLIEAMRFTPDGFIDDTFGIDGFIFLRNQPDDVLDQARAFSAALQSDGKLVIYCSSYWLNGDATVRVDTAGNIDTSWGMNGWSPLALDLDAGMGNEIESSMKLSQGGKMVIVSSSRNLVMMRRLTTDETLTKPVKR